MKVSTLFLALICSGFLFSPFTGHAQYVNPADISDPSFKKFLTTWEEGTTNFINGDPTLYKKHASQSDDATIFGAFGGYGEKGWKAVGARYDWAASQYKESGAQKKVDYLSIVVSGDFAYTVSIERTNAILIDMKKTEPRVLRSTQIFRKENGEWKLLHRHADPLIEKKGASVNEKK
jgi:ketosteroid isomerase-like protein